MGQNADTSAGLDSDGAPRRADLRVIGLVPPDLEDLMNARAFGSSMRYEFQLNRRPTPQEQAEASANPSFENCQFIELDKVMTSTHDELSTDALDTIAAVIAEASVNGREQELADIREWKKLSANAKAWSTRLK